MNWEYLRIKNKDKLKRLNLPSYKSSGKVFIFDKCCPYSLDVIDIKPVIETDKFGIHGTMAAQIVKMIAGDNVKFHGSGYTYEFDKIVDYCIKNNIKVVNSSITCSYTKGKNQALKRYAEWGGIWIASVGNDDDEDVHFPASSQYTIGVSATNSEDSNGPMITVTADSYWYVRNKKPGMFHSFNGTSASAPVIAGCVRLILDARPNWKLKEVVRFLTQNSTTEMKSLEKNERFFSFPNNFGREVETLRLRKGKIQFAVIHHPGKLNEYTAHEVKKVHFARGFGDVGYNYLIEKDGKVVKGRDEKYRGAHTVVEGATDPQFWNENAIGICLVHNGEDGPFPEVMYQATAKLLKEKGFKPAQVRLHREVDNTSCPGRYFDKQKLVNYLEKEWRGSMANKDYEGHWAEWVIDRVKELDIMGGYENGDFKPDEPVTRAEVANGLYRLYTKLKGELK